MNFKKIKCCNCEKWIHQFKDLGYNDEEEEIYYCINCIFADDNLLLRIIIRQKIKNQDE